MPRVTRARQPMARRPARRLGRPDPLAHLPRPVRDRAPRRSPLGRLVGVLGIAAALAAVAVLAVSTASGPMTPVGEVAGADATTGAGASDGPAEAPGTPAPAGTATGTPLPTLTPAPTATPVPTPIPAAELTGYVWPLPRGRLTLPFGPSPWGSRIVDGEQFHDGIDLATFCGDRIVAAHAGTVLAAGRRYDKLMGWVGDLQPYLDRLEAKQLYGTLPIVVVIDDGNGYRSVYAHFGKLAVKKGDVVEAGQLIGWEGRTGRASGCHLHYGLFSPLETATFGIDPDVVKRMKLPDRQIARIDPLLVLPYRPEPTRKPKPSPTATAAP